MSLTLPITVEQIEKDYPKARQVVRTYKEGAEFCGIFATKKEAIKYVVERVVTEFRGGSRHHAARTAIKDLLSYGQTGDRSGRWVISGLEASDWDEYAAFDATYDEIHGARVDAKIAKREAERADRATRRAERAKRSQEAAARRAERREESALRGESESSEGSESFESEDSESFASEESSE